MLTSLDRVHRFGGPLFVLELDPSFGDHGVTIGFLPAMDLDEGGEVR